MNNSFLDFEKPIADIHDKIQALKDIVNESPDLLPQISKLEEEEKLRTQEEKFKFDRLEAEQKFLILREENLSLEIKNSKILGWEFLEKDSYIFWYKGYLNSKKFDEIFKFYLF